MTASIANRFSNLLILFRGRLTAVDIERMEELIKAGELLVGYENFCVQLIERDASVSDQEKAEIKSVGKALGAKSKYWERLMH